MASGMYMRQELEVPAVQKTYGYQRVTPTKLNAIMSRLQNATYTSKLYTDELKHDTPYQPRSKTVELCKKTQREVNSHPVMPSKFKRPETEQEINRIFNRLKRATTHSRRAAEGKLVPEYELWLQKKKDAEREKALEHAQDDKKKWLKRLQRPTTATRQRQFCWFCDDPKHSHYLEMDFSKDDKTVSKDELEGILERMRTPTLASESGDKICCPRFGVHYRHEISRRTRTPNIPLVSGLEKSRSVNEIVNRLHPSRPQSSPATGQEIYLFKTNNRPTSCYTRGT